MSKAVAKSKVAKVANADNGKATLPRVRTKAGGSGAAWDAARKAPAVDPDAMPAFLRRAVAPEPDLPDVVHVKPAPVTDMRMVDVYVFEGVAHWAGTRSFLCVTEGHKVMHLLHVPTFEYVRMDLADFRKGVQGEPRLCAPDLADRIRKRADQLDAEGSRYSRVLVSRALTQLGALPLADIVQPVAPPVIDDPDADPDAVAASIAAADAALSATMALGKPQQLGSKTQIVYDLLIKPEGTTRKDIMRATGWPSVSVDAQAKAAGLTLRKEPGIGGAPMRYFGTPNKD